MGIKITTLIENKDGCSLEGEFGLSLLIQDNDFSFIFDTGKTGKFLENAEKMGIDLKNIHNMVLSHSHFDHTGGVKTFIEKCSNNFTLHITPSFFEEKHKITELIHEFLGNNFDKKYIENSGVKIHYIEGDEYKLSENITLHTNFKQTNDFETPVRYYFKKIYDDYILDNMEDEIAVTADTPKGLVIICGCSHIGIANITETIKNSTNKNIYGIVGGLHLSKASDERMDKVLDYFIKNNIKFFGVSHCTGEHFIEKLKQYNPDFIYNNTGNIIEF